MRNRHPKRETAMAKDIRNERGVRRSDVVLLFEMLSPAFSSRATQYS